MAQQLVDNFFLNPTFNLFWKETRRIHKNFALGVYGAGSHSCKTVAMVDKKLINITYMAKLLQTSRCVDVDKWIRLPKTLELLDKLKQDGGYLNDSDVFMIIPDAPTYGKHHNLIHGVYVCTDIFPYFYSWINPEFDEFLQDHFAEAGIKQRKNTYIIPSKDVDKIIDVGRKRIIDKIDKLLNQSPKDNDVQQ